MVHVPLIMLCLLVAFPFYYLIVASTQSNAAIVSGAGGLRPSTYLGANLTQLFSTVPALRALVNSVVVAAVQTIGAVFFCTLGGFGFAKFNFRGKNLLFVVLIGSLALPPTINIVPWFRMMAAFGWVNNFLALIVPNLATAFGVFYMRQYIGIAIPTALLDAARIDGCSSVRFLIRFVFPLARPAAGTLAIFTFLASWNSFLQPFVILNVPNRFTLPVILSLLQSSYDSYNNLLVVASALSIVPVLVAFGFLSKTLIRGLTAGALSS